MVKAAGYLIKNKNPRQGTEICLSRFKFGRICISETLINSAECKIIVEFLVKKYRARSPSAKIIKSRKTRREDLYGKNYMANYIGIGKKKTKKAS